jgi:Zn-dependent protease with chaperone function
VNGWLALAQLTTLTWLGFAALMGALSALAYPRWRARAATRPAPARARLVGGWLAAPVLGATWLTALCFVPSALSLLGLGGDHCEHHDDAHTHFCFVHRAAGPGGVAGWVLVGLSALTLTLWLARQGVGLVGATRRVGELTRLARASTLPGAPLEVEASPPFAATVGFFRPRTLLSTGLRRAVDVDVLKVVLAHERAHAARYDNLRKVLAVPLTFWHGRVTGRQLLDDLSLACEQACDEVAAAQTGDRLRVAEAIVAVGRVTQGPPFGAVASSFGEGHLALRVGALLEEPTERRPGHSGVVAFVVAGLVALACSDVLHDVVETFVSQLGG